MYFDLEYKTRTDGAFRDKLTRLAARFQTLSVAAQSSSKAKRECADIMLQVMRLCRYNPSFLIPYYFPKYPKNKPMSLKDYPFTYHLMATNVGGFTVVRGSRQIGKALQYDEPVLTPTGWVPIWRLNVGDTVFDHTGNPTKVTAVTPQGVKPLFRMTFSDDSSVVCCEEHLWNCKTNGAKNWTTKTLGEIRKLKGGDNPTSDQGIRIPLTDPIQFPSRTHYIHPYVLGALLGDGSVADRSRKFTSEDPYIVDRMQELSPYLKITKDKKHKHSYHLGLTDGKHQGCKPSKFLKELRRLDLIKVKEFKHIPEEYLYDSVENRIELLRGLMDTDGSIYGKCAMEFSNCSFYLANGVKFLVESLGGKVTIKPRKAWYKNDRGEKVYCKPSFRVIIKLQGINPFSLPRKADRFYDVKYDRTRILKKIEQVESTHAVCIAVESPHKTFITKDCIVTHNSTTFAVRQRMNSHVLPKFRSLYIAPKTEQTKTYANRLREVEQAFRFKKVSYQFRQNLQYKEYPNGSVMELINVDTTPDNARGKTADELLFDEYQNFDPTYEAEVKEVQSSSEIPVTLYAGTSLTTDTALEARWEESSQGLWMLKCPACNHENLPLPEYNVMDMIQPKGCCCAKCGNLLDVKTGHFVHMDDHAFRLGKYGFHIPQIIVPGVVNNQARWQGIYDKKHQQDPRKFFQENLGIPSQEGEREITETDLKNICILGDRIDRLVQNAREGRYAAVFSGCDWGGSDYDASAKTKFSRTAHVVLGLTRSGLFDVMHMKTYEGMAYQAVANDIMRHHHRCKAIALGADHGVGYAYNMLLREQMAAEHHFIYKYSGPNSVILQDTKTLFNLFSLNRTEAITSLYYAIRTGRIRCYEWELAKEHLLECLNLVRIPNETSQGTPSFLYRKHGSKADDILHALNFAYVTGRVYLQENIVLDTSLLGRMKQSMMTGRSFQDFAPGGRDENMQSFSM